MKKNGNGNVNGGELAKVSSSAMPLVSLRDSVEEGGITSRDFEIPRSLVLYKPKFGLQPGALVNNISGEDLKGKRFIPLFVYKNFAKFTDKLQMEWSTLNAKDPRVIKGLKWRNKETPPEVTEMLNFVGIFGDDMILPLILSYKRTSLGIGRKFNTLFSVMCGIGVPNGRKCQQYIVKKGFDITVETKPEGKYTFYLPFVSIPKDKTRHMISDENQILLAGIADSFSAMIKNTQLDYSENTPGVKSDEFVGSDSMEKVSF